MVRQTRLPSAFALAGRIVVAQGNRRDYGQIDWQHRPDRDRLLVASPLGQGVAELRRDADGARLLMADGRQQLAPDWETLAAELFGAPLPLDRLPQWLSGEPLPPGSGWTLEILRYQSDAPDALPALIELRRGETSVRVRIDEWSPLP